MTNKELENKIAEKFISIMRKLRNLAMGYLMENCSPYFKTLIMACMKMMQKEEINFKMSPEERQATNDMFRQFGVPDRIRLVSDFSDSSYFQMPMDYSLKKLKDNQKLQRIYNLLDRVDNLLDAKDMCDKLQTFKELSQQIENEYM
ncbi:MAG: hypothetical protein E7014_02175 [Alphaproteobacteria bacterium]|nr:hypothetical protein [Alphaproteobacteria bacterium]